jgi:hypothetical protein
VRVVLNTKTGRRTYELTYAKVRALQSVSRAGRVSDATPFATARALVKQELVQPKGSEWFITPLGQQVRRRAVEKMNAALSS